MLATLSTDLVRRRCVARPSLALVMRTALSHGRSAGILVALAHGLGWGSTLIVALGIASSSFNSHGR